MTHSMTAFASITIALGPEPGSGSATWEIRSVNHRYLEPGFRLPDALRMLEPELRERLRAAVQRGKIDCTLRLQQPDASQALVLDQTLLAQVLECARQVSARLPDSAAINPMDILAWPGLLNATTDGDQAVRDAVLTGFDRALADLIATRAREGSALATIIRANVEQVEAIAAALREQLPTIMAGQRLRLRERIAELRVAFDDDRVEQEMVILAQKSDVAEELDRLQTHAQEVRRILNQRGPSGRRLDFLMQELNREANTLSAKALVGDTTRAAIDLKVLIEQMREQIQNIE